MQFAAKKMKSNSLSTQVTVKTNIEIILKLHALAKKWQTVQYSGMIIETKGSSLWNIMDKTKFGFEFDQNVTNVVFFALNASVSSDSI